MTNSSDTIRITPGETLEVLERSPGLLVLEATYAPGGSPPPAHLHPGQSEHFEVLAGTLQVEIDGQRRPLAAGERLDVAPGTPHRMWNAAAEPARTRWETRPAGRTEQWFRALAGLQGTKGVDDRGQPKPLAFAAVAHGYQDVFRLAGPPAAVTRVALAGAAVVARLRGPAPDAGRL